jgi:hypothetical protein
MSQRTRFALPDSDGRTHRRGIRKGFDEDGGVVCRGCFDLKNENTNLKEEIKRLKAALKNVQKTTRKDVVNAHAPSSRIDYKVNSQEDLRSKKGGARPGHKGHGRKKATLDSADEVINIDMPMNCEDCKTNLNQKDVRERTVIESVPVVAKKVVYRCPRGICPKCFKVYPSFPPVFKQGLYGNSLISQAAVHHYVHGITMGKCLEIFGENVSLGGLVESFHRLGRIAQCAKPFLIQDYRQSSVKHADETGWRTDGQSGYAWVFCTPKTSIFEFRDTRASRVAKEIMGDEQLEGVLVVDRYGGYNQMPTKLQYCYAHLLREVERLTKEFPEEKEISDFVSRLAPALSLAMKLRSQDISDEEYYDLAQKLKIEIELILVKKWKHLGIQRIQEIFDSHRDRLYHWVKNREVPAENNRAERELRPTVIARKVSYGSQSDAGAKTRSAIMSLLYTVKKRLKEKSIEEWLTESLNKIALDPALNIATLIPPSTHSH